MGKVLRFSAALTGCALLQSVCFAQSPYAPNREGALTAQAPARPTQIPATAPAPAPTTQIPPAADAPVAQAPAAEKVQEPTPEPVPAPKPEPKTEPVPAPVPAPVHAPEPDNHNCIAPPSVMTAPLNDGEDRFCGYCFRLYGDFLYLKERGSDLSFAQIRDGCGASSVPKGPQGTLQFDYSPGFRVGGEVALDRCSGIQAEFLWWEDQTHDRLVAPAGTVLQSSLTLPSTASCSSSSREAVGAFASQLRTADIAYTRLLCGDCRCYAVRWLAGVYYAHLNQDLHTEFNITGTTVVDTHINFDGAGPRIGLDGECLACKNLYLYGRGTANLVAGHFTGSFTQDNVFAGNQGNITFRDDRVVPILDLELGIGWVSPKGHVRVMAGYTVAAWFNSLLTPEFINAVQTNNFTHQGDNLSNTLWFDGLLARVEFRF
jgi:hypothetical protein